MASPCEKAERRKKRKKKASSRQLANPFFYHQSGSIPVLAGRDVQKSLSPGRWAVDKVNHGLIYDAQLPLPSVRRRKIGFRFLCRLSSLGRHVSCVTQRILNSCFTLVTVARPKMFSFEKEDRLRYTLRSCVHYFSIPFFLNPLIAGVVYKRYVNFC